MIHKVLAPVRYTRENDIISSCNITLIVPFFIIRSRDITFCFLFYRTPKATNYPQEGADDLPLIPQCTGTVLSGHSRCSCHSSGTVSLIASSMYRDHPSMNQLSSKALDAALPSDQYIRTQ